jgi:hypothetical protein
VVWIAVALTLDHHADLAAQRWIGAATWILLIVLLRGENVSTRYQVAMAVVFATSVEYLAAPGLGFYGYRLANVPSYVPPGHGGVYLAAVALGRAPLLLWEQSRVRHAILASGTLWALWGMTLAPRTDALGCLMFAWFVYFVGCRKTPRVYLAAFLITTYLEWLGTWIGAWTWAPRDPTGWLGIGNPPSGIAGGYCVFDAVALYLGPAALRLSERCKSWIGRHRTPPLPTAGR